MDDDNEVATILLITRAITLINAALTVAENSVKFRQVIADAIAEGRELTDEEIAELQADAQRAVDKL